MSVGADLMWTMHDKSAMFVYRAIIEDVYDGDTVIVSVDLGFYVYTKQSCRLLGINAIELRDKGGKEARAHLLSLIPPGTLVTLESVKPDKFAGRFDALITNAGVNVNQKMVEDGYAAPWDGTGPKPVPPWPPPKG